MGLLPHLFPLFLCEVMSNPIKPPKPAKKETRVSKAWNFFSRPEPARESPRAGGLGEAARTPRVRRQARPGSAHFPSPPRSCLRPSGPLVRSTWGTGASHRPPPPHPSLRPPGAAQSAAACGSPYLVLGSPLLVRFHRPLVATTRPDLAAAAAPSDASGSGGHGRVWAASHSRSRAGEAEAAALGPPPPGPRRHTDTARTARERAGTESARTPAVRKAVVAAEGSELAAGHRPRVDPPRLCLSPSLWRSPAEAGASSSGRR